MQNLTLPAIITLRRFTPGGKGLPSMKTGIAVKKQLVAVAANNLARETEFDSITVDMICERAQISRSSFYRLFQDKYDILKWCEKIPFSRGISQMGRSLTCLEGTTVTLECFCLFNSLFLSTRRSSERIAREEAGKQEAARLLRETVSGYHGIEVDERLDFQISWFTSGLLEQCVIWSKACWPKTPAEGAAHIESCCPSRLRAILDKTLTSENPEDFSLQNIVIEGPLL